MCIILYILMSDYSDVHCCKYMYMYNYVHSCVYNNVLLCVH